MWYPGVSRVQPLIERNGDTVPAVGDKFGLPKLGEPPPLPLKEILLRKNSRPPPELVIPVKEFGERNANGLGLTLSYFVAYGFLGIAHHVGVDHQFQWEVVCWSQSCIHHP